MTEQELQDILQSDMRMWEIATTTAETADSITKVMDLPYDIGLTEVTLDGMSDAGKRREAVSSFANYIRNLIDAKVGEAAEEEREAKAIQKAAMAEPVEQIDSPALVKPGAIVDLMDVPGQIEKTRSALVKQAVTITKLKRQLAGLEAFQEAFNAPTHKKTPDGSPASEGEEEVSGVTSEDD